MVIAEADCRLARYEGTRKGHRTGVGVVRQRTAAGLDWVKREVKLTQLIGTEDVSAMSECHRWRSRRGRSGRRVVFELIGAQLFRLVKLRPNFASNESMVLPNVVPVMGLNS